MATHVSTNEKFWEEQDDFETAASLLEIVFEWYDGLKAEWLAGLTEDTTQEEREEYFLSKINKGKLIDLFDFIADHVGDEETVA